MRAPVYRELTDIFEYTTVPIGTECEIYDYKEYPNKIDTYRKIKCENEQLYIEGYVSSNNNRVIKDKNEQEKRMKLGWDYFFIRKNN